eukprot:13303458-Ditylum_brightwellii.AAC.1
MWLADVLPRQWTQVRFPWKKLSSVWFSELVIMSVCHQMQNMGTYSSMCNLQLSVWGEEGDLCVGFWSLAGAS